MPLCCTRDRDCSGCDFGQRSDSNLVSCVHRSVSSYYNEEKDFRADTISSEGTLPPEILKMDESFQKLYREALATGKEEVYNIRVMIVGQQGVGKTSLTQRLLGENVKENETEPTEGIEVHTRCCQIDHATGEWTRKVKTDERFLNDLQIVNILNKYVVPQNNKHLTGEMVNGPVNGIFPRIESELSLYDATAIPSSLDGNMQSGPNTGTLCQSEKPAHITEEDGDVPICYVEQKVETVMVQDETEGKAYPEEIKNFVERAKSLPVPRSGSSDVTLLDFAGQSIFYTTHQAFMSWRTLYLLVTDMSLPLTDAVEEGEYSIDVSGKRTCNIQEYVTYWLNSVHSHVLIPEDERMQREEMKAKSAEGGASVQGTTPNHPFVILVGTHADKIHKDLLDQRKKSYFNAIRNVLKNSPLILHLVDEDFAISNLGSDDNVDRLKSKILETAQKQVYWGEKIPARWIPLSKALMEVKNSGIKVMDYADVESLNKTLQVRIEQPEELDLFLRFEHDMGNIVFFNTERLRKKVVLDPEWLIHGVNTWITSDQVIKKHPELSAQWFAFKNTGRLTRTLIDKLWSSDSEIQHKEYLLDDMEKLNIIAKPLQKEDEEYYWVPCMVSTSTPDDVKKLQQNKDTTKTSTLCFRSKSKFIHVGVFHRLLATCLSKWEPAKEGNTYLLFRGLCVFDLDEQQQLLLSLNDFVIQATVIRFTRKGRNPELPLCMTIEDDLHNALSEISDCLCPGSEFEICIKCKESSPLTNEGLHSINTLRTKDELRCSTHKEAHCVESKELLGFWEEEDKRQIPESVLPQHSAHARERFTRLSSLVLDVGSKVLRKLLLYYTTTSLCTLDEYMKNNEPDILELQKRKVLTQAQVDIIFPQSGQTDINEYDITLASALLNNIYLLHGQQEKQIADLRTKRNELAHYPSTKMSEHVFQTKWTEITTILTDLNKLCKDPNFENKVQKEIQDIQQSGSFAILSNLPAITEELKKVFTIFKEIATVETGTVKASVLSETIIPASEKQDVKMTSEEFTQLEKVLAAGPDNDNAVHIVDTIIKQGNEIFLKKLLWHLAGLLTNEMASIEKQANFRIWPGTNLSSGKITFVCLYKGKLETKRESFFHIDIIYNNIDTPVPLIDIKNQEDMNWTMPTKKDALLIQSAIEEHGDRLFSEYSNLQVVCGGPFLLHERQGCLQKSTAIILYCHKKGIKPYGETKFPEFLTFDGQDIPVDIREGYFALAIGGREWHPNLCMGISIGEKGQKWSGTLGPFVDLGNEDLGFITCAHVVGSEGTDVVQPSEGDLRGQRTLEETICGSVLKRAFNPEFSYEINGFRKIVGVDAALVKLNNNRPVNPQNFPPIPESELLPMGITAETQLLYIGGSIGFTRISREVRGKPVIKYGKKSGLTMGAMVLEGVMVKICDWEVEYENWKKAHVMKGLYLIDRIGRDQFAMRGDSGSGIFLLDENNELTLLGLVVGILPAPYDCRCVVTPIEYVLSALNVLPDALRFGVQMEIDA